MGVAGHGLAPHKRGEEQGGRDEQPHAPPPLGGKHRVVGEAERQRGDTRAEQQAAQIVDAQPEAPPVGDGGQHNRDHRRADGDVDPEDPTPVEEVDEQAAVEGAEHRAALGDGGDGSDGDAAPVLREGVVDDRDGRRH